MLNHLVHVMLCLGVVTRYYSILNSGVPGNAVVANGGEVAVLELTFIEDVVMQSVVMDLVEESYGEK